MRWRPRAKEKTEVVKRFLFLPKTLENRGGELETRWLCRASFLRRREFSYVSIDDMSGSFWNHDIRWED